MTNLAIQRAVRLTQSQEKMLVARAAELEAPVSYIIRTAVAAYLKSTGVPTGAT